MDKTREIMKDRMKNAKLLVDRIDLLHMIPKGGITCEVGVAFGGFSEKIIEICQPKKHFLIDSWVHQGRYDDTAYQAVLDKFASDLDSEKISIIRSDSFDGMKQLVNNSLDFIYIDTNHTYETTRKELAVAAQKVNPFGIIAGHDYKAQGRYDEERKVLVRYGVVEAVQEFMVNARYDMLYLTNERDGFLSFALQRAQQSGLIYTCKKIFKL